MISIITATYNAAANLRHCFASIAAQGDCPGSSRDCPPPIEHIIIDGGSTDGTLRVIKEYVAQGGQAPVGASPRSRLAPRKPTGSGLTYGHSTYVPRRQGQVTSKLVAIELILVILVTVVLF